MSTPKLPKPIDPALVAIDTIAVPRTWIAAHGWPRTFDALVALEAAGTEGVHRSINPRGDLVYEIQRRVPPVAVFRHGPKGEAFLYVQGWDGPA